MRFFAKTFLISMLFVSQVNADNVFDFNAEGLSAERLIGRTSIGVTRDKSQLWVLTIRSDNTFAMTHIDNKVVTGTWRKPSNSVICFLGMNASEPQAEVCKIMRPNGRGTDFRDINDVKQNNDGGTSFTYTYSEHRGTSQVVYSFEAGTLASDYELRTTIYGYQGRIIVGRTLKDRETWLARFDRNGYVDFAYGSGRRYQGSYEIRGESICIKFPDKPELGGCRQPVSKGGKVIWTNPETGSGISEVLFAMGIENVSLKNENNLWALIYQQYPQAVPKTVPKSLPTFTEKDAEDFLNSILEKETETKGRASDDRGPKNRADVRRAIDAILSDYSFGTGTYTIVFDTGRSVDFTADMRLSIRMKNPNSDYLKDLCSLTIENGYVPHERKIEKNGRIFTLPPASRNKFELTFGLLTAMTALDDVNAPWNLIEAGKSNYLTDLHAYAFAWDHGVRLIENTGVFDNDTEMKTTVLMPKSADRGEFWDKIKALQKVCRGY